MISAKDARGLMAPPLPNAFERVEALSDQIKGSAIAGISAIELTGAFWGLGDNGDLSKMWTEAVGILTRLGYKVAYNGKNSSTGVSW